MAELTMVKALNLALHQAMEADDRVIICGQDVGLDEGVFRVTEGLLKKYGDKRVLDSPLAEAGIIGTSIGMALYGLKPVSEIQFSGFVYQGFHMIEQHIPHTKWRTKPGISSSSVDYQNTCPAPTQEGACLGCRMCWNAKVWDVTYYPH